MNLKRLFARHTKEQVEESGVSFIEFILCFPLVFALIAGICDCGLILTRYVTMQSEAATAMRFIEVFTSPSYAKALTDMDITPYSKEQGFLSFFDDSADYSVVKDNPEATNTTDLYALMLSKLKSEYGTSLCRPETPNLDETEENKWTMDVRIISTAENKLIGGENPGAYDEVLHDAGAGVPLDRGIEGQTGFTYYLGTGSPDELVGYPQADTYYNRESNFDNVDVEVVITYKDKFIFPLPFLLNMAAGTDSDEDLQSGEYCLQVRKVGTFYIGGNNW